jgi:hypothetical protein
MAEIANRAPDSLDLEFGICRAVLASLELGVWDLEFTAAVPPTRLR